MTPTKLLLGQILVVFAIVIAGIWIATQWAAEMLAYQPELGPPWFYLHNLPVYHPWALFPWWYHFDAYAPHVFSKAGMLAGPRALGFLAAVLGSLWRARQSKRVTTARRAGRQIAISGRQAFSATTALCWASGAWTISAMMDLSMSWPLRRPVRARAWALSFRPCSPGPAQRSFMTSRVRTGP
jgi:hypothetical protein